jgi:hypothetical protein
MRSVYRFRTAIETGFADRQAIGGQPGPYSVHTVVHSLMGAVRCGPLSTPPRTETATVRERTAFKFEGYGRITAQAKAR